MNENACFHVNPAAIVGKRDKNIYGHFMEHFHRLSMCCGGDGKLELHVPPHSVSVLVLGPG